ncbi:MAG: BREX system ATP-binding domain-containing protein [bacterium]
MVVSSDLIGKRVRHPLFGDGVIEGVRWRDSFVQVKFGPRHAIWLPSEQLRLKRPKAEPPPRKIRKPRGCRVEEGRIPPRRMIEAFRHGVVPHSDIGRFTFGRDKELVELERCFDELETLGGCPLIVEGAYGTGKTHFLDYIEDLAVKRGYSVAKVALDQWEVTPARPWRVYRELAGSFRFQGGGFREFLIEASRLELEPHHIFLTPALQRIRQGKADPMLWEWIGGERNPRFYLNEYGAYWKLPVLLTHSTAADIYSYILSGIGWLASGIGLKGLVILMDEVETTFRLFFDRDKAFGFLKGLIHVALNTKELAVKGGGRSLRLFHSGVRTTPYIYKIPSHLLLVIALTPVWSVLYQEIKELAENRLITLSGLTSEDYCQMFERLTALYLSAYPQMHFGWDLDHVFQILINRRDEGVRFFIKAAVEALDLIRHHPKEGLPSVLKYEYA